MTTFLSIVNRLFYHRLLYDTVLEIVLYQWRILFLSSQWGIVDALWHLTLLNRWGFGGFEGNLRDKHVWSDCFLPLDLVTVHLLVILNALPYYLLDSHLLYPRARVIAGFTVLCFTVALCSLKDGFGEWSQNITDAGEGDNCIGIDQLVDLFQLLQPLCPFISADILLLISNTTF